MPPKQGTTRKDVLNNLRNIFHNYHQGLVCFRVLVVTLPMFVTCLFVLCRQQQQHNKVSMAQGCPMGDMKPHKPAKKCAMCGKEFGVTRWKYSCHVCGEVVCDDCSKTEVPIPPLYPTAVRVCDLCKSQVAAPSGQGRRLGGTAAKQGSAEEEREKRAAAAAARMAAQNNRGMGSRQNSSSTSGGGAIAADQTERNALLAKIEEFHRQQKTDPPFGLRSYDVTKLKVYYNHLTEGKK